MPELSEIDDIPTNNENNTLPPNKKKISFIKRLFISIKQWISFITNSFGIYLLWIIIHYISIHLYVYFCAPSSVYGFMISPFLASAIHCKALNWAIYNSSTIIDYMWVLLGTWICSKIVFVIFE
jgi:hypothetical protein